MVLSEKIVLYTKALHGDELPAGPRAALVAALERAIEVSAQLHAAEMALDMSLVVVK